MSQQLAYVIITPYTLYKSRTGGILARLITRTGLELAGARMFAPSQELVQKDSDGGVLDNTIDYKAEETPQRTLVLIKPDNFRFPTGRPGNVIDFFSRTGLYIVGIKLHRMSIAQAIKFYEPVREVLRDKLRGM